MCKERRGRRGGGGGGGRLRGTLLALVLPLLVRHTAPTATVRMFDFNLRSKRRENPPSCAFQIRSAVVRSEEGLHRLLHLSQERQPNDARSLYRNKRTHLIIVVAPPSSPPSPLWPSNLRVHAWIAPQVSKRRRKSARRAGAKSTN